jgi:hypothetical protein
LPSANSICTSVRRNSFSSSVLLSTSVADSAGVVHAAIIRPLTLAVQTLQLPCGVNSGW